MEQNRRRARYATIEELPSGAVNDILSMLSLSDAQKFLLTSRHFYGLDDLTFDEEISAKDIVLHNRNPTNIEIRDIEDFDVAVPYVNSKGSLLRILSIIVRSETPEEFIDATRILNGIKHILRTTRSLIYFNLDMWVFRPEQAPGQAREQADVLISFEDPEISMIHMTNLRKLRIRNLLLSPHQLPPRRSIRTFHYVTDGNYRLALDNIEGVLAHFTNLQQVCVEVNTFHSNESRLPRTVNNTEIVRALTTLVKNCKSTLISFYFHSFGTLLRKLPSDILKIFEDCKPLKTLEILSFVDLEDTSSLSSLIDAKPELDFSYNEDKMACLQNETVNWLLFNQKNTRYYTCNDIRDFLRITELSEERPMLKSITLGNITDLVPSTIPAILRHLFQYTPNLQHLCIRYFLVENGLGEQQLLDILEYIPSSIPLKTLTVKDNQITIEKLSKFPLLENCTLMSEHIQFPSFEMSLPQVLELHLASIPEESIMRLHLVFPNLQKLSFDAKFVNRYGDQLLILFGLLPSLEYVNTNLSRYGDEFEEAFPDIEFI